ncbi:MULTISPECIES: YchJ family protein [unclassified Thioalkalivibrio]|uniref:YchJ family protein n=1 Tax=unclassified Thioalkalivibrio TaxID=2621013 RepID=UPI000379F51E|nr:MULTISPECIES: YchJ family metal-binding protein [unclassified Thioalkalivibrio]
MGKASRRKGNICACGSGLDRAACCGQYLDGAAAAPTAQALMRSRYAAFVEGREDYLLATWAAATRPESLVLEPGQRWLGLAIRATEAGGPEDQEGWVEFVARSRVRGQGVRLHERSRFRREDGRWVYVDGEFPGA